jgi:hypothetical protein
VKGRKRVRLSEAKTGLVGLRDAVTRTENHLQPQAFDTVLEAGRVAAEELHTFRLDDEFNTVVSFDGQTNMRFRGGTYHRVMITVEADISVADVPNGDIRQRRKSSDSLTIYGGETFRARVQFEWEQPGDIDDIRAQSYSLTVNRGGGDARYVRPRGDKYAAIIAREMTSQVFKPVVKPLLRSEYYWAAIIAKRLQQIQQRVTTLRSLTNEISGDISRLDTFIEAAETDAPTVPEDA